MWAYDGYIQINQEDDVDPTAPGIQVAFGIPSDDASDLVIGGVVILENDGGHGFNGPNPGPQSVDFAGPGLYTISAILTQGGGGGGIEVLSSIGSGNPIHPALVGGGGGELTDAIPAERLFKAVPEPSSAILLGMCLGLAGLLRTFAS